jgi:hypothetical protein
VVYGTSRQRTGSFPHLVVLKKGWLAYGGKKYKEDMNILELHLEKPMGDYLIDVYIYLL